MGPFMVIFIVTILQNVLVCNGISLRAQLEQLLGIEKGQDYTDEYQLIETSQESDLTESEDYVESDSSQDIAALSLARSEEEDLDDSSEYEDYENSQETYDLPEYTEYDKPIGRIKKVFRDQHGRVWRKKHKPRKTLDARMNPVKQSHATVSHKENANGVEIQFVDVHHGQKRDMYGQTIRPKVPSIRPAPYQGQSVVSSHSAIRQAVPELLTASSLRPLRYREAIGIDQPEVRDGYEKNRYPTQYKPEPDPSNQMQANLPNQGTRFKLIKSDRPEKNLEYAQVREREQELNTAQSKQVGIVDINHVRFSESNRPEKQFSESYRPERQFSEPKRPEKQVSESNRLERQYSGSNRPERQLIESDRPMKESMYAEPRYPEDYQQGLYSQSNRPEREFIDTNRQQMQNGYMESQSPQEYRQDVGAQYSPESKDPILDEIERKKLIKYKPYIVRGIKSYVKRKAFYDKLHSLESELARYNLRH